MIPAVKVPPSAEPVTLDEAKAQLRQNVDDDDAAIIRRIRAAREWAETIVGRAIPAQTFELAFDAFPCQRLRLPRPPLVRVDWLKYVDTAGATQTLDAAKYQVSTSREPGEIVPAYGDTWPTTRAQLDALTVRFVAGWACTSVALGISAGAQTVTPASMAGIAVGSVLTIDEGASRESVMVTAVAATTFTAVFAETHEAGARVSAVPDGVREAILLKIEESITGDEATSKAAQDLLFVYWYGGY
jgi:uncharacterized phiE125 gp8 family phage protein